MYIKQEFWKAAAITANNLSQLELVLGRIGDAVTDAANCSVYAERSDDGYQRFLSRCARAEAFHQMGCRTDAKTHFDEAEQMQKTLQPSYPLLYSLQGFQYCELFLASTEHSAWQRTLGSKSQDSEVLATTRQRATQILKWATAMGSLLDIALNNLTLARATLFEAALSESALMPTRKDSKLEIAFDITVEGLRRAGDMTHLPLGLLSRAWLRFLSGARTGPESAQEDLDEAWEIAERGPMRLHMADIHLYRARLFFREKVYPWESPEADLKAAEKLINDCGYHRRDEELADAKHVILNQSV